MKFESQPFNALERRAVAGLSMIFALRMLGLFMVMPVLALYAQGLPGQTPLLVGLAVGIYGLTQALFQIPMGMASDRWGRKPIILAGLLIFMLGSIMAALADTVLVLVMGRALQGAGAIAAAMAALTADLTRDSQRTKAMAIMGVTIGSAFMLALLAGPLLQAMAGVKGMFWMATLMAAMAMAALIFMVPRPVNAPVPTTDLVEQLGQVLQHGQLMRLNFGIFFLHAAMTALFVVVPLALRENVEWEVARHWQAYLPTMLGGVACMIPMIYLAERKNKMASFFRVAIVFIVVAQAVLMAGFQGLTGLLVGLTIFFAGFNFLEAAIPSLVSRHARTDSRGTAMGVFSSFEFLGAFAGGALAGGVYGLWGMAAVFGLMGALMLCWLVLTMGMRLPAKSLRTRTIPFEGRSPQAVRDLTLALGAISGVAAAVADEQQEVVVLHVDEARLDLRALARALGEDNLSMA